MHNYNSYVATLYCNCVHVSNFRAKITTVPCSVGVIVAIVVLVVVVFIIITVVVVGIIVVWKRKKSEKQHTKQQHTMQENVYCIDETATENRPPTNKSTTAYNDISNGQNSNIFPSAQQVTW